jgi:hypothetical protein
VPGARVGRVALRLRRPARARAARARLERRAPHVRGSVVPRRARGLVARARGRPPRRARARHRKTRPRARRAGPGRARPSSRAPPPPRPPRSACGRRRRTALCRRRRPPRARRRARRRRAPRRRRRRRRGGAPRPGWRAAGARASWRRVGVGWQRKAGRGRLCCGFVLGPRAVLCCQLGLRPNLRSSQTSPRGCYGLPAPINLLDGLAEVPWLFEAAAASEMERFAAIRAMARRIGTWSAAAPAVSVISYKIP